MSMIFKTRLFAKKKENKKSESSKSGEKKGLWGKTKDAGRWVGKLPSKGAHAVYNKTGKWGLTGAGALLGTGAGAGVAGLTLRGLKGRLREAHPDWSEDQVQREYDKVKKKRLAIGGAIGLAAGGGLGYYKGNQYSKRAGK
jgi:hypothetical protein|nr:MAG TPA: protein of unknown function (DUF3482) [Caudoviricetes sp.]